MTKSAKIALITVLIIIVAAVIIFFPLKIRSRLLLDQYRGMSISGRADYYIDGQDDFEFEMTGNTATNVFLDWLGSHVTMRSFKNIEKPLVYSNHWYTIRLVTRRTYEIIKIVTNGRYIEIHEGGKNRKYRIVPKGFDIEILDELIKDYIEVYDTGPLTPIEFEDISESYQQEYIRPSGWLDVEFLDAHSGNYYYAIFYDVRPYENIEIFDDGSRIVVYYDEGEGKLTDVELKLSELPHSKVIYFLNGERSYNVMYAKSME